jgi:hypothetical protein
VNREPVVVIQAFIVPALIAFSLVFAFSDITQGLVNAALLAAGGFITAAFVSSRAALPLLSGLVKAVLALVLGLGVSIPANWQAAVLGVVAVAVAFFTQSQVTAKGNAP